MEYRNEVAILVPVLRRPHRVAPLLASIAAGTPEPHRIVFVATAGDEPMIAEILRSAEQHPVTLEVLAPNRVGDYARKINHGALSVDSPFLFCAADDLAFHPGWATAALEPMIARPEIGVVGTQDLAPTARAQSGAHSTHSLIRRAYMLERGTIDEPGKILHESYPHEYVDDELVATAKARHAWKFARRSIVEHLHPSWGKAPMDPLYAAQHGRMLAGRRIFERRRILWER